LGAADDMAQIVYGDFFRNVAAMTLSMFVLWLQRCAFVGLQMQRFRYARTINKS
jgi:hypothetical protein